VVDVQADSTPTNTAAGTYHLKKFFNVCCMVVYIKTSV